MQAKTVARDCLYLNWSIPLERMPPPPSPLRYDTREREGAEYVFVSTVLFRLQRVRALGLLDLSHPQLSFHLCTLDAEGRPSFAMQCVLIPSWALPGARLVARQPAHTATFDYPVEQTPGEVRQWRVCRRGCLEVAAREGSPPVAEGPHFGSWERTVSFFLRRSPGYFPSSEGLRQVDVTTRQVQVVPMSVQVGEVELLTRCLALVPGEAEPEVHSAWFCPEVPFLFERADAPSTLPRSVPAPG